MSGNQRGNLTENARGNKSGYEEEILGTCASAVTKWDRLGTRRLFSGSQKCNSRFTLAHLQRNRNGTATAVRAGKARARIVEKEARAWVSAQLQTPQRSTGSVCLEASRASPRSQAIMRRICHGPCYSHAERATLGNTQSTEYKALETEVIIDHSHGAGMGPSLSLLHPANPDSTFAQRFRRPDMGLQVAGPGHGYCRSAPLTRAKLL